MNQLIKSARKWRKGFRKYPLNTFTPCWSILQGRFYFRGNPSFFALSLNVINDGFPLKLTHAMKSGMHALTHDKVSALGSAN